MTNINIENIWNSVAQVTVGEQANVKRVRNYVSPSDLGKAYIDRYLKMKGEQPSNPYDERILRIFDAGRLFEWIVLRSFAMAGILKSRGSRKKKNYVVMPQLEGCLKVWGYYDAVIGGTANWQEAKDRVFLWLKEFKLDLEDEVIERYTLKIIDGLEKQFGNNPLPEMIIDVKSINSRAFWSHKNRDENDRFLGYDHHKMQMVPYMLGIGSDKPQVIENAALFYVSKDDLCLQQVPVVLTPSLKEKVEKDIRTISNYYLTDTVPSKEEEVIYDYQKEVFDVNWEVARSPYLTKVYGYKDQNEFQTKWHGELLDVNRALRHLRDLETKQADWIKAENKEIETKLKKSIDVLDKKIKGEDTEIILRYDLQKYK